MKKYLTSEQVCEILHIRYRTLMTYLKNGLPSHKVGRKHLFDEQEVRKFIEER